MSLSSPSLHNLLKRKDKREYSDQSLADLPESTLYTNNLGGYNLRDRSAKRPREAISESKSEAKRTFDYGFTRDCFRDQNLDRSGVVSLNDKLRDHLDRFGFVILDPVLCLSTNEKLCQYAFNDAKANLLSEPEFHHMFSSTVTDQTVFRIANKLRNCEHTSEVRAVAELFANHFELQLSSGAAIMHVPGLTAQAKHRDSEDHQGLSIIFAHLKNYSLYVCPGSHNTPETKDDDTIKTKVPSHVYLAAAVPVGGCIIFHQRLHHYGSELDVKSNYKLISHFYLDAPNGCRDEGKTYPVSEIVGRRPCYCAPSTRGRKQKEVTVIQKKCSFSFDANRKCGDGPLVEYFRKLTCGQLANYAKGTRCSHHHTYSKRSDCDKVTLQIIKALTPLKIL